MGTGAGLISLDPEMTIDPDEYSFLWEFNCSVCAPLKVQRGVQQDCTQSGMQYSPKNFYSLKHDPVEVNGFLSGFNSCIV